MRLDNERESGNVEDRRGEGGGGFGFGGGGGGGMGGGLLGFLLPMILSRFGIGGVVVLGLLWLVFGGGLGALTGGQQLAPSPLPAQQAGPTTPRTGTDAFVAKVLATTEDTWTAIFKQSGETYQLPKLVLFSGATRSACGSASAASGPFYCPGDQKVYLDTAFFDELSRRFGAPGDFAAAYVVAHEIGHHVQNQLGLFEKVKAAQARGSEAQANAIQVRVELQADCYAGVWAAKNRSILDQGDFEEGVRAAQAIGDDTLQRGAGRTVSPDSFTHGSSAQRVQWLTRGFQNGDPASCDTFSGAA